MLACVLQSPCSQPGSICKIFHTILCVLSTLCVLVHTSLGFVLCNRCEAGSKSLQIDLMDHPLYTISYVADIENVLVIMINRILPPSPGEGSTQTEGREGGGKEGEEGEGGEREVETLGGGGEGEKEQKGSGVEVGGESGAAGESGKGEEGGEGEGEFNGVNIGPIPRMTCHVLETNDVSWCCVYIVTMYISSSLHYSAHVCMVFLVTFPVYCDCMCICVVYLLIL